MAIRRARSPAAGHTPPSADAAVSRGIQRPVTVTRVETVLEKGLLPGVVVRVLILFGLIPQFFIRDSRSCVRCTPVHWISLFTIGAPGGVPGLDWRHDARLVGTPARVT
ncbi:MAG: hypothetical protein O3B84_08410, partial [Chloroflexi bacterium]|nr:hypothetical protein [Chloroflexota bacterium]